MSLQSASGSPASPHRGSDRRASHRYLPAVGHAWLGWRDPSGFRSTAARILDVSSGGCLLASGLAPPPDRTILIRLDGPLLPVWFEVRVLEVAAEADAMVLVRLIFAEGCPYELFMAAVYGIADVEASRRQPELPGFHDEGRGEARRGDGAWSASWAAARRPGAGAEASSAPRAGA